MFPTLLVIVPWAACTLLFPFEEPPSVDVVPNDVPLPPPDQAPVFSEPQFNSVQIDGERYGAAVAVGRFTQTDRAELAVGIPGANGGAGAVVIHSFDEVGNPKLYLFDAPTFFPDLPDAAGTFGSVLAVGRFDDDNLDDLAIGAPGAGRGRVCVIFGEPPASGQIRVTVLETQTFDAPKDALRYFGHALATGDFNDDGRDDLVVGEPAGDNPDHDFELDGTVWVFWGGEHGLAKDFPMEVRPTEVLPPYAQYGWSVAVGNFATVSDDLKFPDLAVGATNVSVPDAEGNFQDGVGRIWLFKPIVHQQVADRFDQVTVLHPTGNWTHYVRGFGHSLAVGNVNGDFEGDGPGRRFYDELIIGAPNSSIPADGINTTNPSGAEEHPGAGLVCIARNNQQQLINANLIFISQEGLGLSEASDHFGWAVAADDFNRDGADDLAIGSPNESLDAALDRADGFATPVQAGAIFFRFGAFGEALEGGVPILPTECYDYLGTVPAPGWSREGDRFGSVLLAADADDDGDEDLIVGAPDTDTDSVVDAGAVWIGHNDTTPPGPLDGRFTAMIGDCEFTARLTIALRDRNDHVCGHLRLESDLCLVLDDIEVTVRPFVDVVSTPRNGNAIDLHYTVQAHGGGTLGMLQVSAEVLDDQSDMIVNVIFESDDTGIIHGDPITLLRQ